MYIYYMPFFPLVKSPGWGGRIKRQNAKSSSGLGMFSVWHDGEKRPALYVWYSAGCLVYWMCFLAQVKRVSDMEPKSGSAPAFRAMAVSAIFRSSPDTA